MHRLLSTVISTFITFLVFGITFPLTVDSVFAITISIYPTEDTNIDSDYPNDNFVGDSSLDVTKSIYSSLPTEESIGLLRFDLSNRIPIGSTVNGANLRLMPSVVSSTTPHIGVYKYSNDDWDPVTVTWNNFPAGAFHYLSVAAIPYDDQYYYWNVLPGLSNGILSLALKSTRTERGYEGAYFRSVNSYDESDRPLLVIDYTPPPGKAMPWLPLLLED